MHRCCKPFYHVAAMACSLFLIPLLIWGNRSESINAFPHLFFSIRPRCFFVPQVVTHWGNALCFFFPPVMWNPLALASPSCRSTMRRFKGAHCPALAPSWRFGSSLVLHRNSSKKKEKKNHSWKDEWPFKGTELKVAWDKTFLLQHGWHLKLSRIRLNDAEMDVMYWPIRADKCSELKVKVVEVLKGFKSPHIPASAMSGIVCVSDVTFPSWSRDFLPSYNLLPFFLTELKYAEMI